MINTYNYCCLRNDKCSLHGKTQQIKKDKSEENEPEFCLECNSPLKLLGMEMTGGIMRFASADDKGKREIISKRSKKHFEKYDKKEVDHKKKQVINQMLRETGVTKKK